MFSVQCSLTHAVFAKNKRIYNINDDDDIRISFHSFSSVSFYLSLFFLFPFWGTTGEGAEIFVRARDVL